MRITTGFATELPIELFTQALTYRHKVFVDVLGWQLNSVNGLELDQFDRADTLYVVAQNENGRVNGCARLLPTHRPYLLAEVFPQLFNGLPLPCSSDIWELSRFAAMDMNTQSTSPLGQFSSEITISLLRTAINCAAKYGAKRIITVSPLGVERLLRRAGFIAQRAGPPVTIDGQSIFACWIDVE